MIQMAIATATERVGAADKYMGKYLKMQKKKRVKLTCEDASVQFCIV
jgi:hypothetical protein